MDEVLKKLLLYAKTDGWTDYTTREKSLREVFCAWKNTLLFQSQDSLYKWWGVTG